MYSAYTKCKCKNCSNPNCLCTGDNCSIRLFPKCECRCHYEKARKHHILWSSFVEDTDV